ncbi:MAG TPA: c-type cytochrome [Bryobacteraceae bacterium]|nr:c-type cytochrome [Bryobacteraceae bacterium]
MIRRVLAVTGAVALCTTLWAGLATGQKGKGDAAKGKESFEQCTMCHNVDSPEKKMGPSLQGLFKRKTLQNGKPVNDDNVMAQINNGGNGMPAYADMLSADEKANILAYLHTL